MGHDKTRGKLEMATTAALYQAGSTSQNPFALSRPPAALPPLPLNHTIPAAPVALPVNLAQSSGDGWDNAVLDPALLNTTTPASTQVSVPTQATGTQPSQAIPEGPPSSIRSFVKRMPPQFKAQWDAARAEEDRRILSEDIVRRNKEKFHHAVTFKQWVSVRRLIVAFLVSVAHPFRMENHPSGTPFRAFLAGRTWRWPTTQISSTSSVSRPQTESKSTTYATGAGRNAIRRKPGRSRQKIRF